MAKYKVGDTVKVIDNPIPFINYRMEDEYDDVGYLFTHKMEKYTGKVVKIAYACPSFYYIEGDEDYFVFTDEMFTDIQQAKRVPTVHQVDDTMKFEIHVEKVLVSEPATIVFYRTAEYNDKGFEKWSNTKKSVAKCNVEEGDVFDPMKGYYIACLKAFRKESDKALKRF